MSKENRARFFSVVSRDKKQWELKLGKFHLNLRKSFFTVRMIRFWDSLTRDV